VSQFSDESGPELRQLFFETAQELLQSLNEQALKLEKDPSEKETVKELRRIVHTLKGDAAATGFRELSELSHQLEDALALDSGDRQSLVEIAFTAADTFAAMIESYRGGAELPSGAPLQALVKQFAGDPGPAHKASRKTAAAAAWNEYELLTLHEAVSRGLRGYHVYAVVDPNCAMPIAARQLLQHALSEIGEVLAMRPEAGSAAAAKQLEVLCATLKSDEEIAAKCRIPTAIAEVRIETLSVPSPNAHTSAKQLAQNEGRKDKALEVSSPASVGERKAPKTASAKGAPAAQQVQAPLPAPSNPGKDIAARTENILRIDAERIDTMISLVGELIIGKSMLQQALNELAMHSHKDPVRVRFADAMAFQARALNDLQRAVMKVRMVPAEQLFRRFPRMVRDVAKQCGRKVEVVLKGQDTDLDKGLLDAIAEPMTHLVRNAISHGIESAEERTRNGKPVHGTITLNAYHQGNQVVVEISDDGRGIDVARIRACGIKLGLLDAEATLRMNENELLQVIFRPGFTTAETITEVSGRGVGLDIVGSVLNRLKGSVQVETEPGKGTRFRLRLPLTLAIIQALLFRVQRQLYAIPLNAVAEITRGKESDLHLVEGREVLQLRDHVLPIIRLGQQAPAHPPHLDPKIFVLVVSLSDRRFGLLVDALAGEEELVIKPLDDHSVESDLVSGASILGDGKVVLILNLAAVVDRFAGWRPDAGTHQGFVLALAHASQTQSSREARA
jgi:two-component system, chemotaxis family, sensor kinase CheA